MTMEVMRRSRKRLWERKGQNTVEYLMMMAVIVGIVLIISTMFKGRIKDVFNSVMEKITGAVGQVSATN